ncbi:DUF805 domain-containing protein [Aquipuribacter sp. MA13-6]|uniref:DUF805 domain-containing protein n=1 Tax=unclassified Aquipuribacter TaxID=2635084 RepID=UPI003EEF445D
MTFTQAVSSVLGQYAGFRGRARRSEFWWWNLFTLLVGLTVAATEVALGIGGEASGPVSTLLALVLLLPNLSVSVRRLHDSSRSGWWLLIALVPVAGFVVLLLFFLAPSTAGGNAHGPDPRLLTDLEPSGELPRPDEVADGPTPAPVGGVPGAAWTPPGWDLPDAAEPGAGRPVQDRGRPGDDPDPDRPPA